MPEELIQRHEYEARMTHIEGDVNTVNASIKQLYDISNLQTGAVSELRGYVKGVTTAVSIVSGIAIAGVGIAAIFLH